MKVLMSDDLSELYLTGKNKTYSEVGKNRELYRGFVRAVNTMMAADNVEQLKGFSYLHYEQLRYQYSGISSVRLSNRYVHRLLFTELEEGLRVDLIEIDKTHYGNKK